MERAVDNSEPLTISVGEKTNYLKNEKVTFNVDVIEAGYLNVLSVDEQGATTLLFPNRLHPDNKVAIGKFTFPTSKMKFDLIAQAPFGKTLVVAILSDHQVNLQKSSLKSRTKSVSVNRDVTEELFKQLSNTEVGSLEKSFGVKTRKAKSTAKAGKIELMTCETAEKCE